MDHKRKTDILIIGGGIAGCIAAISLVSHYHVTLIDKLAHPLDRIGESLAPAAKRILAQLDLLTQLPPEEEHLLFRKNLGMQSFWGSDRVQITDHLSNPDGLGLNLNRKAFESYLRVTAVQKGVNCIWPAKHNHSTYSGSSWDVKAKVGSFTDQKPYHITAKFVIDATGRQSHFARHLGIEREHHDKLMACWLNMPNHQENKMSTISATELGWWYSAVVPNNKRVLAFQTDSDLIDKSTFKSLNAFLELAQHNKAIAKILDESKGSIEFNGPVASNSTRLTQVAGRQWAALGDAAISFDPLSSQGMFHAMANALQLKELIIKHGLVINHDEQVSAGFKIEYTHQLEKIWEKYLQHKRHFYNMEKRWATAPFWKRRHQ